MSRLPFLRFFLIFLDSHGILSAAKIAVWSERWRWIEATTPVPDGPNDNPPF